jgi:hypothetical protein
VFEAKLTKENPFRVTSVTTCQDALVAASQNVFSAILWDMRLTDTARLLPRMRALCPLAVLLLLTTDDRPSLDSDLARLDVSDILVKPLNLDTLVDRVRAALDAPQVVSHSSPIDMARVGQRLEVSSLQGVCSTRVLDSGLDTFIIVGEPRVDVPADFRPGLPLQARIVGEDAIYSFRTRLVREIREPIEGWEVQKPTTIRREQRRRYPRHRLDFPISLTPTTAGVEQGVAVVAARERGDGAAGIAGRTEDLAVGGCALIAEVPVPAGTPVQFTLTPHTEVPITGAGTVLRSSPHASLGSPYRESAYRLALQFGALTASCRRRLRSVLDPD